MSDEPEPNCSVYLVGYTPEEAPSKSHAQFQALMRLFAEEMDVSLEGGYSTLDSEEFDRLVDDLPIEDDLE